jgi:hypothetical protein
MPSTTRSLNSAIVRMPTTISESFSDSPAILSFKFYSFLPTIQRIQSHETVQTAIASLSELHYLMFKENHTPFFPFSILVPIDDLLTVLITILDSFFILYLTVMFVLGALHRFTATSLNVKKTPIQDAMVPFKRPLTGLTIRQLKQRARTDHIRRYSRMRKPQLIAALQAL